MGAPEKRPIPSYMVTLGDMWSLMLTFFIMIVALSEMDATKFKKVNGSIKNAFGFQKIYLFNEAPSGSSILKSEHASASSSESPILDSMGETSVVDSQLQALKKERNKSRKLKKLHDEKTFKRNLASVYKALKPEIDAKKIGLVKKNKDIIIRISEKASFGSGSAKLNPNFRPLMKKISRAINDVKGNIRVAGHTDNSPLRGGAYRTNWELSSARAAAVGQALIDSSNISENRFVFEAYGASKPYVKNSSPYQRSQNRRVEIIITKP